MSLIGDVPALNPWVLNSPRYSFHPFGVRTSLRQKYALQAISKVHSSPGVRSPSVMIGILFGAYCSISVICDWLGAIFFLSLLWQFCLSSSDSEDELVSVWVVMVVCVTGDSGLKIFGDGRGSEKC